MIKRICWDIETVPFTKEFQTAPSIPERINLAPEMRIACVYDLQTRRYIFFLPQDASVLIDCLLRADQSISYNGKGFDLPVLRRHHGLSARDALLINRNHVDLCEIVAIRAGRRISLDHLSRRNLGEKKAVQGRQMGKLDLATLRQACKSDVRQTHRLWKLHCKHKLVLPTRWPPRALLNSALTLSPKRDLWNLASAFGLSQTCHSPSA